MTRLSDLLRLETFLREEIVRERERSQPETADLVVAVAALYEVPEDFLSSPNLTGRPVIHARFAVCWLLRQRGLSTVRIGRVVGRDHTSVLNACRVIEADPPRLAILRQILHGEQAVA